MIADGLCQDIQEITNQLHDDDDEMDHTTMQILQSFSRNCKLRQDYERKLCKEQGLVEHTQVKIPSPGVPMDYTFKENAFVHGDEQDDETISDMSSDEEWAKSLVTDQEESETT